MGDLLKAREPGIEVSVLETRPAGRLTPAIDEASYGPSHADPWPGTLDYPELIVRHYEGNLVSLGAMRLYAGNTILPESFRWPRAKYPSHPRMRSVTPLFARLDRPNPTRVLRGDFYYLDCVFPSHFGHLTTEVLCRLWGWERAKREIPGLRVLFHTNTAHGRDGSLERRLVHRVRDPRVRPDVVGPTRAPAKRGGSPHRCGTTTSPTTHTRTSVTPGPG